MSDPERVTESGGRPAGAARGSRLKDAVREARIEMAERTGVVVDLRDAAIARLELLNEALDPIFAEMPADIELFDRGIVPGDPPRLWIDMIAHVVMGRDRRTYRFLQDTRYGRRVLAESSDAGEVANAVTKYVARRLVERERMIEGDSALIAQDALAAAARKRRRRWWGLGAFLLGLLLGAGGLLAAAWLFARS
jgi:hypothetical protein